MDFMLIDGDMVEFGKLFGTAVVTMPPVLIAQISGSCESTFMDKNMCVKGDETKVELRAVCTSAHLTQYRDNVHSK